MPITLENNRSPHFHVRKCQSPFCALHSYPYTTHASNDFSVWSKNEENSLKNLKKILTFFKISMEKTFQNYQLNLWHISESISVPLDDNTRFWREPSGIPPFRRYWASRYFEMLNGQSTSHHISTLNFEFFLSWIEPKWAFSCFIYHSFVYLNSDTFHLVEKMLINIL